MRLRVTFSKTGPLVFIGNLDLLTVWGRAARRAGLSLSYSQGFHPQPKIQFASPLPLGFSSCCEVLDMRLNEEVDPGGLGARLQTALPPGIDVLEVAEMDAGAPLLQTQVVGAEYEVSLLAAVENDDLHARVDALLTSVSLARERRGKPYDLRPLIENLRVVPADGTVAPRIQMRLKSREAATGRPDEVLDALGIFPASMRA